MKSRSLATLAAALAVTAVLLFVSQAREQGLASPDGKARAAPTVWTVSNPADAGPGTLRQALLDAHSGDTITFSPAAFPPVSPTAISLANLLPVIHQNNLTIDASNAGVVLDGSGISGPIGGERTAGLGIEADGVVIRGLQIVNFPGCGIELRGQYNTIGGDRVTGAGPLGQGDLFSGNGHSGVCLFAGGNYNTIRGNFIGVDTSGMVAWGNAGDGVHINGAHQNTIENNVISGDGGGGIQGCCNTDTSYNIIRQNLIGVGVDEQTPLPNGLGVWFHDGASHNTIGPGNIIAHSEIGVEIDTGASTGNTITRNSLYENGIGIRLGDGGNASLRAPGFIEYDLPAGFVTGLACSRCVVEVFSDDAGQGKRFEGQVEADSSGYFILDASTTFIGPHLTATATDAAGNTSAFSPPTTGTRKIAAFQKGNANPLSFSQTKPSRELADNGFSNLVGNLWEQGNMDGTLACAPTMGIKVMRATINEGDSWVIDWTKPEDYVSPAMDEYFTALVHNGLHTTYILQFYDKAWHQSEHEVVTPRFQTQAEIDRYLEYVDFIVSHFRDRIDTYELFNEPGWSGMPLQWIRIEDYINLARQTIPRIKAIQPEAKIAVGSFAGMDSPELRQWFMTLISSDEIMPLADVVSWHPFFEASLEVEQYRQYYAEYPALVAKIQALARAHGFAGQFRADELVYSSPDQCVPEPCTPEDYLYSDTDAAKYYTRAIILHTGMDVAPGPLVGCQRAAATPTKVLATLLAGAKAEPFPFEISTTITNVLSYTFALPGGDRLLAFWDHGWVMDDYPETEMSLRLPGFANYTAYGLDVLSSFQQRLVVSKEGEDLLIDHLLLRDYPLLVRLAPPRSLYLPVIAR